MMTTALTELSDYIAANRGEAVIKREVALGDVVFVVRRHALHSFIKFLKTDEKCAFSQLSNLCGADYPEREERFDVVYNLLSLKLNHRIRVIAMAAEDVPVDTITDLYSAAGWFEREVWDLFGIPFAGHPDLRRILTDYGFEGHPLRKDFPLTGYVEVRYDDEQKRVRYEPVKLTQEFRQFDFLSPWEGAPLPGDEKAKPQ